MEQKLVEFLERKVQEYNQPAFIPADPISIPHAYTLKQDIEIAGFFAALFAWGQRTTILQKSSQLLSWMGPSPHAFLLHHRSSDLQPFLQFRHRTFNATDVLYLIHFLQQHYQQHESLEPAFSLGLSDRDSTTEQALNGFYRYCFQDPEAPQRTRKHIAAPMKQSTCKRLNMYLRWMVRDDQAGVDFGLWKQIKPHQLVMPIDLHVARVARRFGLLTRKQTDWQAACELTDILKRYDPADPVKYDFALFALGVIEKF